jgi:hypothetical protein
MMIWSARFHLALLMTPGATRLCLTPILLEVA